jgi:hypothetical protein
MKRLGLAIAAVLAAPVFAQSANAPKNDSCRDLKLTNGRIVTMDKQNTILTSVTIHDGVFVDASTKLAACARTINLHGRTVTPGIIDNHNHIVLLGMRPGYDTRLETAASIAEVQAAIKARAAKVPAGKFVTAMGGWNPVQFAEKRLPTLAELDAADSAHPVLVFQGFTGPAAVNTAAKAFFESKKIAVSATGQIAGNMPSMAALNALRAIQTLDDQKRGTADAMAYAASVGVTTSADMGAFVIPGTPDVQQAFTFDTLASADPFKMYDAFVALHREGKMAMRLRVFYLSMDTLPDVPLLKERLRNTFPDFGDDMLRNSGIGEFASNWPLFGNQMPTNYETALKLVAKEGWAFQQHSLSPAEDQLTIKTFEAVNAETPIKDLRWSIAHVPRIDKATVERFKALGAGVAIHPFEYLAGGPNAGPPLRMILDSGIHAGAGSDAAQISTIDPWLMIYYMVTGKNSSGVLINDKQQITRMEAMRLYTADNGWFLHEENKIGTIEPGRLADLVVLSDDYFDPKKVSDEGIKKLKSVMTVVDGKVVYEGSL